MGTFTVAEIVKPETAAALWSLRQDTLKREARKLAARKGWATRRAKAVK